MTALDDAVEPGEHSSWTLARTHRHPRERRAADPLFTLGSFGYATAGTAEDETDAADGAARGVLVAGVYAGAGADQDLLPGPDWTRLDIRPTSGGERRMLDLRTGVLFREELTDRPVRTARFVSAHRPGVMALRAEGPPERLGTGTPLCPPDGREPMTRGVDGEVMWARVGGERGISAAAVQQCHDRPGHRTVERIAAYGTGSTDAVADVVRDARRTGFDDLLAEHHAAWARRWDTVDVSVPDDPAVELAARFALFQLWCNVGGTPEAAVGPRGLSGHAYAGHVLWDAEAFVLPAIVSMDPALALAMIDYRVHRLSAARALAYSSGHRGARFPWESAANGYDVTPTSGTLGGEDVPIRTGRMEEHVTADVAWAAWHCAQWTGDDRFVSGHRRALLVDTARYWASRSRIAPDGRAHIHWVIGPDEYHESVSDNAYTNIMARWNLRTAAAFVDEGERAVFSDLAARLVDGYEPTTGRYEQFDGYFELEPLTIAGFGRPPLALDALLGPERVAGSQLIKQPDVLMLHHLVPDELIAGTLGPNLDFYLPRTAHGSSLSPGINASLLARAGRPDDALRMLHIALRMDLDDVTESTASGLHLATMGSVWQAFLFGFAGVRVRKGVLRLAPVLPSAWGSLALRFRCLGRRVRVEITRTEVAVEVDAPLRVCLVGAGTREVTGTARWRRPH